MYDGQFQEAIFGRLCEAEKLVGYYGFRLKRGRGAQDCSAIFF